MEDWIPTKNYISRDVKDRFFKYVDNLQAGRCWNWTGGLIKNGYGEFWLDGKNVYAHRTSYLIFFGDIPFSALVLHKCDNKRCVNPNHLYLGTHTQNLIDRYSRHPETRIRIADRRAC